MEVTGAGEETALAGIMRLVGDAQASRSRAQDLADRAAFFLTLVAIGARLATLLVWLLLGAEPEEALSRAAEEAASKGQAAIYLLEGDRALAVFAVADAVREESKERSSDSTLLA